MASDIVTPESKKNSSRISLAIPPTPLLTQIGYGTGVSVYHFDRQNTNSICSPWAIKKVNRKFAKGEFAMRLHKEAELLKSFNHPNIVGFRGFTHSSDGREVLAMEECTVSLGDMIECRMEEELGPFPAETIIKVIKDVAAALQYLHEEKKIIHADLKSHNVLIVGEFEQVKVCDFGVSVPLSENGTAPVEEYVGTRCWSAPEVLGDGPLTPAADMFSLGLCIWEMISLTPPHVPNPPTGSVDDSAEWSIDEKLFGSRPALPEVPLGPEYLIVVAAFNMCTEQDHTKRPSAASLISFLDSHLPIPDFSR